jgi:hypothetical protein
MKKIVISTIAIIIVLVLTALIFDWGRREPQIFEINSNSSTTENILQNSTSTIDMPIIVNNIEDNQEVSNPIKIEGKARGNWFFEATFPVQLVDTDGNIIASTTARAETDWMTTDFVNFTATLEYVKSTTTARALIVLNKDNPSGNPDFDQSIFIPVILK